MKEGDTIMVFARSEAVESLLVKAHRNGVRITVIVVDNPPFYEGR